MNEKLTELAKEAGFYIEPTNGVEHYAIPMLEKFAELVQANNLSDAEAKLKLTIEALQGLIASVKGYRKNISDNQPCDAEVFAKQALEKIGE